MSYFNFHEIRPLPLPSPNERVIEMMVDEILFKIIGQYLFPITYNKLHFDFSETFTSH